MTDRDAAKRFFDAIARRYDRVYALRGDASKQSLARALALVAGRKRVLVLGVGTGRELSALLDAGHAPTGLDVSDEMIALCNRRTRPVPIVRADFWERLPLEDASFDAAVALHGTIAHPPEGITSVRELSLELGRVLTRGSAFVAEVPTREMLAHIPAALETGDGRRMEVRGDTLFHTDTVTGATIEAALLSRDAWIDAFCKEFTIAAEPIANGEIRLVATRT